MDRDLLKKNVVLTVFVLSLAIVILPMVETSSQKHDAFGSPFTTVVNVSHDNGLSYGQKIAASGNNVYVVWTNGTASTNPPGLPPMINNILFAKSTDGGSTFGTPIRISNNPGDNSLSPVIAQDGTNIYISWIQSNFGNPDIYFAKSTDGGTTFSSPINISRSGSAGVEEEFVAASGNHVYIAWVNNLLASNQGILYVNSTDNGVSFSLPHQMSGGLTNNHDPKILLYGNYVVYLAWDSQDGGVYLRSSIDDGRTFGSSVNVSQGAQGGDIDIATIGSNVYATWMSFLINSNPSNKILFAKSHDFGGTFLSPITVSKSSLNGFFPQLATLGNHVYLTWQQAIPVQPYYDIDVATSSDYGESFSYPVDVTSGTIESHSPQINTTANNVYLTWQGYHPNPDVFYSNSTDYGLTYTFPRNTSQDNLAQNPQLAASSGNVYLAWTDNSAGNGDIYVAVHSASIPTDTIPPTLSITSPANNTAVNTATPTVTGTASDDTSVSSVTWKVDSGAVSTATGITSWSFTTGTLSNGPHTIYVNATDAAGLVTKKHLNITVAPPTSTVQSSTGAGSVTFSTNLGGFSKLVAVSQASLSPSPPTGNYPFGFFNFTITGINPPGSSVTVTINYPTDPGTVYEKVIGSTYYTIPVTKTANPDGTFTVTLTLTDGAVGQDGDGLANGQIVDPGAMVVVIPTKVTGGGHIGKNTEFGLEAKPVTKESDDHHKDNNNAPFAGEVEYDDKTIKINLHSNRITFVSADSGLTTATIQGDAKVNNKPGFTFRVDVTDPDKTGQHDIFLITITDSSGKVVYQNSGIVKGHIEIHKVATGEDHHDNNNNNNDHNDKNSK